MADLGTSPLCESFIKAEDYSKGEPWYPLHVYICSQCYLAQIDQFVSEGDIFHDYAYFSAYSTSWVTHAKHYVETAVERLKLTTDSFVVEVASNDGYLLQFVADRNIRHLGVEPSFTVATAARERGVVTEEIFFGEETALDLLARHGPADLIAGNNVYAHVPDINDFTKGLEILLAESGTVTLEFPHLAELVANNQFDTIYHEHFSYLSLTAVSGIFEAFGLRVYDVEQLPTHGGSLRIWGCKQTAQIATQPRVAKLLEAEKNAGMLGMAYYEAFADKLALTKHKLLSLLVPLKMEGKTIAAYGAPGKGNTLLNYCGIGRDMLDFAVDKNPYKHGRFTPGMRIPIYDTPKLAEAKPDYVLILPWNLKEEIMQQCAYISEWGGRFIVPIPEPTIY
jgi:hypothetical protein